MAAPKTQYICSSCNASYPKWFGKCSSCGEFGTLVESAPTASRAGSVGIKGDMRSAAVARPARRVSDIDATAHKHTSTGIGELDRVLGGGLVSGQAILLAGEPGVGKALALDTKLATPEGFTTMGRIQEGEYLIGSNGLPTKVIAVTEVLENRPCFIITFSDGTTVTADAQHQWYTKTHVERINNTPATVKTTETIFNTQTYNDNDSNHSIDLSTHTDYATQKALYTPSHMLTSLLNNYNDAQQLNLTNLHTIQTQTVESEKIYITSVVETESVPVKCVQVDNEDHTYLITEKQIPTHNSTLLMSASDMFAQKGKTVLYVSGEESAEQIALRARRMGVTASTLLIADETDLSVILGHIEQAQPDLVIVDSVQTIASPDVDGRAGGIAQVQEVSATLTRIAKATHIPIIIIAQVTKEGNIAGPKTLEHLVDTVLFFEGDRNTPLRLLRTIKNRFGAADEIACFEQDEHGIKEVIDPSGLFRTNREEPMAGTCITVAMEGRRPILAEVQALVASTNAPNPRRGVSGLDSPRMAMLVAVTERHGRLRLFDKDTFLATVAGMKITEPAADLAVCMALASAAWNTAIPQDVAAVGEVALSGDIRSATNMNQRLNEAARLGFKRILVPVGTKKPSTGGDLILIEVPNVQRALQAVKQMSPKSETEEEN